MDTVKLLLPLTLFRFSSSFPLFSLSLFLLSLEALPANITDYLAGRLISVSYSYLTVYDHPDAYINLNASDFGFSDFNHFTVSSAMHCTIGHGVRSNTGCRHHGKLQLRQRQRRSSSSSVSLTLVFLFSCLGDNQGDKGLRNCLSEQIKLKIEIRT